MMVRISFSSSRGLGVSLLERVAASCPGAVTLLTTQYRCNTQYSVQYSTVQYTGGRCSAAASVPAQQDMLAAGWIRAAEKTVVRRQGQRLLAAIFRNSILGLDN